MTEHRWSGWPGAWCLDCGTTDPGEEALAHGCLKIYCTTCSEDWPEGKCIDDAEHTVIVEQCEEHKLLPCPEPNSHRFDPYYRDPIDQYGTPEHESWLIEMEKQEG